MQKGETFEVELLEVDDKIQGNSLEIGVTTNNPESFDMPRTMTDCTWGTNFIVTDRELVKNGKPIDMMNNSITDMLVSRKSTYFSMSNIHVD